MDARVDFFKPHTEPLPVEKVEVKTVKRKARHSLPKGKRRSVSGKRRRVGREAIKAGMAASLAVSMLTGMRVIKPMSLHGPASWVFVGLTLAHTLIYEIPNSKSKRSA
uniref:Uncharacterized protein n=1 Tax=Magnetococcus massalia (strain MO-1) TaxID=451514 RepID=A0A1S7LE25_MAGMO|nr:Conserved protein of unknown function [Candidatus Magnetococcus massalia]